jgi:hypothetical protein
MSLGTKRTGCSVALVGISLLLATAGMAEDLAIAPREATAAPAAAAPVAEAAAESSPKDPQQALRERADSYWKLRVERSPRTLEFYPRDENGLVEGGFHAEGGTLEYRGYEIKDVVVDGERGVVVLEVKTKLTGEQAAQIPERFHKYLDQPLTEEWVLVEGTWYKKPMEGGLSRFMKQKHDAIKQEKAAAAAAEAAEAAEAAKAANKAGAAPSTAPDAEPKPE